MLSSHDPGRRNLVCATYGYAIVGKGTISELWKEVPLEAQVSQVLRKAFS